jgi:hypothetical protein
VVVLLGALILCSCSDYKPVQDSDVVLIPVDIDRDLEVSMDQIFDSIRIVRLEGGRESNISRGKDFKVVNNRYYIRDQGCIFVFDGNGRFISNSKNRRGRGPNEYFAANDFFVEDDQINILDWAGRVLKYDSLFNFTGDFYLPREVEGAFVEIEKIDDDRYLVVATGAEKDSFVWHIYSKSRNEIVNTRKGLVAIKMPRFGTVSRYQLSGGKLYHRCQDLRNSLYEIDLQTLSAREAFRYDFGHYNFKYTENSSDMLEISSYIGRNLSRYAFLSESWMNDKYLISRVVHDNNRKATKLSIVSLDGKDQIFVNSEFKGGKVIPGLDYVDDGVIYSIINSYYDYLSNIIADDGLLDETSRRILSDLSDDTNAIIIKYYLKDNLMFPVPGHES